MTKKNIKYTKLLIHYDEFLKNNLPSKGISEFKKQFILESIYNWSNRKPDIVYQWILRQRQSSKMKVSLKPINDLREWKVEKNGNIKHKSNKFFSINGLNISNSKNREVGNIGWDQPIIKQYKYDGGILGLLRKKINGIPYYLVEAKEEPGNFKTVQLSPTIQATFSNLEGSHSGRKVFFYEMFRFPKKYNCNKIFDQWVSEDGGRFYKKRNKIILLDLEKNINIKLKRNFMWMTLWEINFLLNKNALVSPHLRSILSYINTL